MEEITAALRLYGLETVILALAINICTAFCKIPVKLLARKAKDSASITRFIVLMPIVIGFVFTLCYARWIARSAILDKAFLQLWLTASGLSLTFYAVAEKLFPAKSKSVDKSTLQASKELIEKIADSVAIEDTKDMPADNKTDVSQKIVLKGRKQDETEK